MPVRTVPNLTKPNAVVIGSGPNGLAAAITIALAGHSVLVYEAEATIGGGARSAELTLPEFIHDVCSSVHPLGATSKFFNSLPLKEFGLEWIYPEAALAHPFDDGTAILLTRSLAVSSAQFGPDEQAVQRLLAPFVKQWNQLSNDLLCPAGVPRHAWLLSRFAWSALLPAATLARRRFQTSKARAVFAGIAAHSTMSLSAWGSSAFGILLWTMCHSVGWPFARGGSQAISNALAGYLRKLGGEIVTGARIHSLADLPKSSVVLCDLTPRQLLQIAGDRISRAERHRWGNYRYGPGVFKVHWSLDAPIPWNTEACRKAGTVHVGGSFEEIVQSEEAASSRESPVERPFLLVAQPSLFDPTRVPPGKHTAWAYCHVPSGSICDMLDQIESQVERFASGFRSHIIGRSMMRPTDFHQHDANLVGGDISGGAMHLRRLLLGFSRRAYRTSIEGLFLCSASTPPGPGVHGLCGHLAGQLASEKYL
jgi:phytoene dehydrogenase-like protein